MPLSQQQPLLNSYEIRLMVRELVAEQGVDGAELLAGSGVTLRQLENPAHCLTQEQELLLYTRIAQCNRDPLLGVRTGSRLSLPNYGMLGHALMGVATLNEALQLLAEFAPLVSWASHSSLALESPGGVDCRTLTLFPTAVDAAAAGLEIESTFASLQALFNDLSEEPVRFAAIEMAHANRCPDDRAYRQHFGCTTRFGCARNALSLPVETLSRRLPHPQPEYRELFRELCRQSMSALAEDRGLVATVRNLVEAAEGAPPTLQEVAAHFGQSARTLRRRLHARGASFQALLDEARFRRAGRYLASTGMTVDGIARQLGYADARSFRFAFRRWSGVTPADYRRQIQGEAFSLETGHPGYAAGRTMEQG